MFVSFALLDSSIMSVALSENKKRVVALLISELIRRFSVAVVIHSPAV